MERLLRDPAAGAAIGGAGVRQEIPAATFMTARRLLPFVLALALLAPASAEDQPARPSPDAAREQQHGPGVLRLLPRDAVSEHAIELVSGRLSYTATAGTFPLVDQSGERKAEMFYTAYVAGGGEAANRPVTFVFNGGPGAASAFLHLGLVGPKLADFGPQGRDGAAARLRDNPESWLAFTDLVLIDPVGTGYSRTQKPDDANAFYNIRRDAESIAKIIALYVAKNGRSASPKYLLGESYGGFRAVKVAKILQHDQGIVVSGILMVSPLLDAEFLFGGSRHALGAALQLPSLIATELERHHGFSTAALADGERFALGEYLTTLAGPPPAGEKAEAFYGRLAQLSGLPLETVAKTRGFIRDAYLKNLRGGQDQVVSRYDASFATPDPYPEYYSAHGPDPILDGFVRALGGIFVGYARSELGFKTDITYALLASEVSHKWSWHEGGGWSPPSVQDDVRDLLAVDPSLRILIAHGVSDMVIPYAVSRYVIDHLPQIGALGRVELKLYRAGHMFYLDDAARRAFTVDARELYRAAGSNTSQ
jgi:carboxypeptidase C (cathepsin A)